MNENLDYTIWLNDISKENLIKLVKHCDKKIDAYFAKLNKRIEKIVKKEVRCLLKK